MSLGSFVAILTAFTVSTSLFCGTTALQAEGLENKVVEYHLDNGLTLLVAPRHDVPTFTAFITVGVGAVNEQENNRGIAHLLEHMRFKGTTTIGTKNYSSERDFLQRIDEMVLAIKTCEKDDSCAKEQLQSLHASLKELQVEHRELLVKDESAQIYARHGGVGYNAFTSKDLTAYLVSLPANKLELWISMEADRMKDTVLREFYTEKEVVLEERRRSYETNPSGMMYETLLATAFRVHPYRHPIIGWTSDIHSLSKEQTRKFMEQYYMPSNTVIALVGDIDALQAKALIEQYFGDITAGVKVPEVSAVEPAQNGERRAEVVFHANPQLLVGYHKPTIPHRDDYAFDLLGVILGRGSSSRLHRALVLEQQLASAVSVYSAPGARYPNLFVVGATPRHPHTCAEVEQALYAQLEEIKSTGVTAAELEHARKRLRADRMRRLRSNQGLASMLTHFEIVSGSWKYLLDYDEILQSITAAEVKSAAADWLNAENRSVVTLKSPAKQGLVQGTNSGSEVMGEEHAH
ncbi:MAG: pitrilysin family protein [Desulfuromonas sp.]|nr:pitrilysin family protein [Desulfuromonas sp.]